MRVSLLSLNLLDKVYVQSFQIVISAIRIIEKKHEKKTPKIHHSKVDFISHNIDLCIVLEIKSTFGVYMRRGTFSFIIS